MNQARKRNPFLVASIPLVITAWLSLIGCNDTSNSPSSPPGTWTVTGKTAFVGVASPLGGVTVKCGGQSATSAPDGSYELRGVPEGTQVITAEGPNCKPYSKSIEVSSNMRYFIYLDFNGTAVSGYVSNFVDGPIQGAAVRIGSLSDMTDHTGHYLINDVPLRNDSLVATHPRYYPSASFFSPAGPDVRSDLVLQRDTVVLARITADQFVDETQPGNVFATSRLTMSTNGFIGPTYYGNNHRHIYMNFEFPPFMRDSRVALLDGSLELCSDAPYGAINCEVFAVSSPWAVYLSYNQQPVTGVPLGASYLPTVVASGYATILTAAGLQQLLASYRANGFIYGIKIQAQPSNVISRTFYSSRWASIQAPRVHLRVRF